MASLKQTIETGLLAIEEFAGESLHRADCSIDPDGTPCDCGYVEARDVAVQLRDELDALASRTWALLDSLADQQAMPDETWRAEAERLLGFRSRE